MHIWSVGELTQYIRSLLEENDHLQSMTVEGEVSNLTYHGSGHVYFSLKDRSAQLSCVMFKSYALRAPRLKAGDRVELTGDITVYPPRGNYQLMVRQVRKAGLGALYQQFLELKSALEAEGLFDPARKQAIPAFPQRIVIITSPTGAALRDILRTLGRRYPHVEAVVVPAIVQGDLGEASILEALKSAVRIAPDVIILARGGGSIEDLWNFNEESVARAVAGCPVPVISGIGHETDFTIVDFVADLRASTPTAAAESAVPDARVIIDNLADLQAQLNHHLRFYIDFRRQVVDDYAYRMRQHLDEAFQKKKLFLEEALYRMRQYADQAMERKRQTLNLLEAQLHSLDAEKVLSRGFTLTLKDGKVQKTSKKLKIGDPIETVFIDGRVRSNVGEKRKKE